jgi:hypothetical protein
MSGHFTSVVVCDFEYETSGDLPKVLCMVAHVLDANLQYVRTIRTWRGEFGAAPPFDISPDTLFVAYSAWAELTCFLALGWKFPEHVFDQHTAYLAASNILLPHNPDEVRKRQRKRLPDACRACGIKGWEPRGGDRAHHRDHEGGRPRRLWRIRNRRRRRPTAGRRCPLPRQAAGGAEDVDDDHASAGRNRRYAEADRSVSEFNLTKGHHAIHQVTGGMALHFNRATAADLERWAETLRAVAGEMEAVSRAGDGRRAPFQGPQEAAGALE